MFDTTSDAITVGVVTSTLLDELRSFTGTHFHALRESAVLLYGSRGIWLAHAALYRLTEQGAPVCCTMRALDQILDLLMLENDDDPYRIQAELFAAIDPTRACVEEICLLADQLSDLLDASRAAQADVGKSIDRRAVA